MDELLSQNYVSELETGITQFYSGDWKAAESTFDKLIADEPRTPEAYFFRSMVPFWRYFFGGETNSDAEEFLKWSDKAIKVTTKHLRKNRKDTSAVLYLSGLHGYRALVAADLEEYSIAIKSGMTGFNFTKKILKLDDSNVDAMIGKGIYYYMTGSVPSSVKWMTNAMGFDGKKEWGFESLEKAGKSDARVSVDANMILSYLYLKEQQPELATASVNRLLDKYQNNSIFVYYKAKSLEQSNKYNDALNWYTKLANINDPILTNLTDEAKIKIDELNASLTETMGSN